MALEIFVYHLERQLGRGRARHGAEDDPWYLALLQKADASRYLNIPYRT